MQRGLLKVMASHKWYGILRLTAQHGKEYIRFSVFIATDILEMLEKKVYS